MRVVSLFDASGAWSRPWADAGANVTCVDLSHGHNVLDLNASSFTNVDVVLAAPPCTAFTKAGARWWKTRHDPSGLTAECLALVEHTLDLIAAWEPRVWALENPVGRLPTVAAHQSRAPLDV